MFDSVRGAGRSLRSSTTGAEQGPNTGTNGDLTSFNPDGFSLGSCAASGAAAVNVSSQTQVAWTWRAGGPAVSNSDGTITSQVSANTDYGFSVVTWTGNATAGATIGHGLSSTPKWIIVKARGLTENWPVFHSALGATKALYLDLNLAQQTSNQFWNNTAPTSSVFSLGSNTLTNSSSSSYVAYCWSEVSGFSKFGSYTGTSSTVTVTTGFKPRWVLVKNTTTSSLDWVIVDSERSNADAKLFPNTSAAESAQDAFDFNDDGFTIKVVDHPMNKSGDTFIYAAFADRPGNNWDVNNIVTNEGLTTSKTQFDVVTYTGNGGSQKIGGEVYSSGWSGSINSTHGAAASFDGNDSTYTRSEISATATWTAATSIPFTTLKLRGAVDSGNGTIEVNGVDVTSQFTANSSTLNTQTITGVTSPLTSIKLIGNASSQPRIAFVEIDGTVLLDGTGPGLKFQPDFLWIKSRSNTEGFYLANSVSGLTKNMRTNATSAEQTNTNGVTAADANGFTLGDSGRVNGSSQTYVAWAWKAGGTAVSNTDGSITSSVSANAQYGFSIVTFTTGTAAFSVGHGLSTTPKLVIHKDRDNSYIWTVYHADLGPDKYLTLNSAAAATTSSGQFGTGPTDSVVNFSSGYANNNDGVCYCFADVPGYQRIGSYVGGGTTDTTVVTGFKPRFLLAKNTTAHYWFIADSERADSNPFDELLYPNETNAETTSGSSDHIRFNSDGFTIEGSANTLNQSGATFIYLAIGDDEIGSDEDCLVDVPNAVTADADATDTTGGYQRGNYATLNPLEIGSNTTFSNGNLEVVSTNTSGWRSHCSTIAVSSGKYYFEADCTTGSVFSIGIADAADNIRDSYTTDDTPAYAYNYNGKKYSGGTTDGGVAGASFTAGDLIGVAFDLDNGEIEFFKNGVSQGTFYTNVDTTVSYKAVVSTRNSTIKVNFGQMRFKYPMPSGYAALNTTALPAATIEDGSAHFEAVTYTGNGSSNTVTGTEFTPDLVWLKSRSGAHYHFLHDAVRGGTKGLFSNTTGAEYDYSPSGVTAFNSDGFTVNGAYAANYSGASLIAWAWNAGSSTVSNTDGNITSSVRANASAGFSIVGWTGTGVGSATVGHGLNAAPKIVLIKNRTNASDWAFYHTLVDGSYDYLYLNATDANSNSGWNAPTNSVFSASNASASSTNVIAYCFAPVAGYSAFGSYEGNGNADGPFVNLGFAPRLVILKNVDASGTGWIMFDSARDTDNPTELYIFANTSSAEDSSSVIELDFLSNGFKINDTWNGFNGSGNTFIYMAFASNPFQANGGLAR